MLKRRMQKIAKVAAERQHGLAVVLEDIHDPHNAEAVFRTCDAFGVQDVYLIFEKEKPFNPRKIGRSTSSSANKWLNFHVFRSTRECLNLLKKKKYFLAATVLNSGAKPIYQSRLRLTKLALILGNEHSGLSPTAVKLSDLGFFIPMRGMVQSLNLSVTAGIFLYEISRQRNKNQKNYTVSAGQAKKIVADFLDR